MERHIVKHESEVPNIKRIGVIGGFGQWSTHDIMERILRYSAQHISQYGNRGYPPIDQRWVNRSPLKINEDGSIPDVLEPSAELLDAAKFVGQNVDFLILLANTPHFFRKEIEETAGKPLLSMVDLTVDEVVRRNYKRVGVMAIGPTLDNRLYQDPLAEKGIESVPLPKELSERLDEEGIYAIEEGAQANEVGDVAFEALDYLRQQNVEGIILGCSEIPILLGDTSNDPDIINPSQLLAEAAVKRALS